MKKTIIFIALGIVAIILMASCSSQKKLQRRVEKHGIKESISFVIKKYPEYFKSKDTVIHDTLTIVHEVAPPEIDTSLVLSDSSGFWIHNSDSLSVLVNKLTGELKLNIKPRIIYIHDTIPVATECPQIICPDCDDLKDNTKTTFKFPWWLLIVGGVVLGAFYIWSKRTK